MVKSASDFCIFQNQQLFFYCRIYDSLHAYTWWHKSDFLTLRLEHLLWHWVRPVGGKCVYCTKQAPKFRQPVRTERWTSCWLVTHQCWLNISVKKDRPSNTSSKHEIDLRSISSTGRSTRWFHKDKCAGARARAREHTQTPGTRANLPSCNNLATPTTLYKIGMCSRGSSVVQRNLQPFAQSMYTRS